MTGIIILNWNGWDDTIECLKSLFEINNQEFFIVLVDNGSTNDSLIRIKQFFKDEVSTPFYLIESGHTDTLPKEVSNKACIIYDVKENLGFAKGNNRGLEIAKRYGPEYYLLLNNDTEVQVDFLDRLVTFIENNPQYSALTPRITYYFDKEKVWNCGGSLWFGFRKYYYANQHISNIKEKEYINIGYITGCALFFKAEIIKDEPLLTEKFFHGEEDFEFSYRVRRNGRRIACVLTSHIYHKVGVATRSITTIGKTYAYYLLRFIDMKSQMSPLKYYIWKTLYFPYIFMMLKRRGAEYGVIFKLLNRLNNDSGRLDGVNRDQFFKLLNDEAI